MFSTLRQQISPHGLVQRSQSIELLVEELGSPAHARFSNLVQPLCAMTRRVDLLTPTANTPASIQSLDPIHHPSEIFADGQVTAGQFLQGSEAVLAMVDGAQISAAEQIGALGRVNLVALVCCLPSSAHFFVDRTLLTPLRVASVGHITNPPRFLLQRSHASHRVLPG